MTRMPDRQLRLRRRDSAFLQHLVQLVLADDIAQGSLPVMREVPVCNGEPPGSRLVRGPEAQKPL